MLPHLANRRFSVRVLILVGATLVGCGGASQHGRAGPIDANSLFPLHEGNVWTYDVDDGSGENVLHFIRTAAEEGHGRFQMLSPSGESVYYEAREDGIYNATVEAWMLRNPIRQGTDWDAMGGRTARITQIDQTVELPAGRFTECVVVSETGSSSGLEVETTYCPDVGPVIVESRMTMDLSEQTVRVVARLRAYQLEGDSTAAPLTDE